jgi:DNA polymerase-3 subunit alpha
MNHTDKVVNMIEECRHCKIKVISPDINQSVFPFTVNDKEEIIYGL